MKQSMLPKNQTKKQFSRISKLEQKHIPKIKLGQLVRTADTKRVFSKGGSTNWSYKLNTITEVIHDANPSYRIDDLPGRYNEN